MLLGWLKGRITFWPIRSIFIFRICPVRTETAQATDLRNPVFREQYQTKCGCKRWAIENDTQVNGGRIRDSIDQTREPVHEVERQFSVVAARHVHSNPLGRVPVDLRREIAR